MQALGDSAESHREVLRIVSDLRNAFFPTESFLFGRLFWLMMASASVHVFVDW